MSMTYEYKSNEYDEFVIAPRYLAQTSLARQRR